MSDPGFFERVYALVRRIPRGRVATYGQVAVLLGVPRGARAVGWALRAIGGRAPRVPWHRVVGSGGRISLDGRPAGALQRRRLRQEGVRFTAARVDLARHGVLATAGRARIRGRRPRRQAEPEGSLDGSTRRRST
jgi:methylated-DNA-protein-cysteine methyltransferase related protein